jgi:MerR family copper efflux transcriptional regulator
MNTSVGRQSVRHITIGAVARRAGVGIDTIRYYERSGLLPEPRRRASGYRDYGSDAVERLRFIRRAKDLGFTLEEIRELLALSTDRERGVKNVRQRAEARLGEVERRIRELQRMKRGLRRLIDACPGEGALEHCPILRALGGEGRA